MHCTRGVQGIKLTFFGLVMSKLRVMIICYLKFVGNLFNLSLVNAKRELYSEVGW